MLYTALTEQQPQLGYHHFLQTIAQRLPWWKDLLPEHVCAYVQLAAGLKLGQPSLAIWTMDNIHTLVDGGGPPAGQRAPHCRWFQQVLSAAITLRQDMQDHQRAKVMDMMPAFITASTQGSAINLYDTANKRARVSSTARVGGGARSGGGWTALGGNLCLAAGEEHPCWQASPRLSTLHCMAHKDSDKF
jgi:hypothetical protein